MHTANVNARGQRTYWLGGSPCAGKSSVADLLAERYGLTVYRCDDAFFRHTQICNPQDQPALHAIGTMSVNSPRLGAPGTGLHDLKGTERGADYPLTLSLA